MNPFRSILVPLDGSAGATRSLGCASWLAARLGARLHILSATSRALPAHEELRRLQVAEEHWPLVELHQAPAYPADAILSAIAPHRAGLVVMTARGGATGAAAADGDDIGHVTRAVIERSPVPVLLLPDGYREARPWQRVLVPVSGGIECDRALALSVDLANALQLAVFVAHVVDDSARDEELAARARYSDALHHEYAGQLEELIARATSALSHEQRRRLHPVALERGDVASELRHLLERQQIDALVVGWHGQYAPGRACVLKGLLPRLAIPLLLVRCVEPADFHLRVGQALD